MSYCKICGNESGKLFTSRSTGYLWCPKCLQAFVMSAETDEELFCNLSEPTPEAQATIAPERVNKTTAANAMQTSADTQTHSKGGDKS